MAAAVFVILFAGSGDINCLRKNGLSGAGQHKNEEVEKQEFQGIHRRIFIQFIQKQINNKIVICPFSLFTHFSDKNCPRPTGFIIEIAIFTIVYFIKKSLNLTLLL